MGAHPQTVAHPVGYFINHAVILAMVAGIIGSMPVWSWMGTRLRGSKAGDAGPGGGSRVLSDLGCVAVHGVLLAVSMLVLASGSHNPFIYFRF